MKRSALFYLLSLVAFATVLAGCATGYHARGFSGGYSEVRTNPDSFLVSYNGNGYTSSEDVVRYVLLRASELTIKNGYRYFIVLSSSDQTSSYDYSNTYANASGSVDSYSYSNYSNSRVVGSASSSTYSGTVVKPGASIRIKCFNDVSQFDDSIDAQFYWDNNR